MKYSWKAALLMCAVLLQGCQSLSKHILPPDVAVQDFQLHKADFTKQTFSLKLNMKNRNQFALPIAAIDYAVSLGGVPVTSGKSANESLFLSAGGSKEIELKFDINMLDLYSKFKNFNASSIDYTVTGNVTTSGIPFAIPFDRKGQVPFSFR